MPNYDVECPNCGTYERFKTMADRHAPCDKCQSPIQIQLGQSTLYHPFTHYFDMGLGAEVTSLAQRRRLMKAAGFDFRDHPPKGELSARIDKAHEQSRRR